MQTTKRLSAIAGLLLTSLAFTSCGSTGGASGAAIQVNKPGDGSMTCKQIVAETNEMNEILGIAEGEMRNAQMLGLTQGAAVNAALYSGGLGAAGSSLPYLGSALNLASSVNNMNKEKAQQRATAAYNRRSVLTGMYAAKGCGQ